MKATPIGIAKSIVVTLTLTAITFGQTVGFDIARMDRTVKACDNFFEFANGAWLKSTEIPPAYPSWGSFEILEERNREILRDLLESAAKKTNPAKGSDEQLTGDYYSACMDLDAIEKAGAAPLRPFLDRIAAVNSVDDLQREIARLRRSRVNPLFYFSASPDERNSTMNIAVAYQGGLGLPNRDYYTKADAKSKELRDKYVQHLAKMFELLGDPPGQAKANAETVMRMEMRLALASRTPVELRDPVANYNKMTVAEAGKLMPGFDWAAYGEAVGAPRFTEVNLAQPDFFKEAAKMIAEVPLGDWKTYLRWTVVNAFARRLSRKFDEQDFEFFGKTLEGTKEQLPRWRRCTGATDAAIGEALGQEYVRKHFTPEAKRRMDELITNLFEAYRDRINKLDWMTEATRTQALAKLNAIERKIGHPSKLRGYVGLDIDRRSYLGNVVRANEFSLVRDLQDIGRPVDRSRWGMTPPTVNAYYNATLNEIVFPAGILQPPFFNFQADDAVNYGAIGGVIGHELTHGFDDEGSQYDAAGNLRVWWTPEDRKSFEAKTECVTAQFGGFEVEKDLFINGKLTLGENIADLGGLAIAYDAFKRSLEGKQRPADIDGFTPEQRFFLGWAQGWAAKERPEYARMLVQSDPHSLPRFRTNGPLANLPEFAQAFSCKLGDRMVSKSPCRVW